MPSANGLDVFVRKNQPNDEEWFGLIEARRALIAPHLDSFTLRELGSLECLRSEISFTHKLAIDAPVITGDSRFSLKTQGIFRVQPWSAIERTPNSGHRPPPGGVNCSDGMMRIWGLTRSGLWVIASISFAGEAGYKGRGYERARTVEIIKADLPTIAMFTKVRPEQMWRELGDAIKAFARDRLALYDHARRLAQNVEVEELALSLIPEKA